LIEFSYELSLKEGRTGTPERPLSDLGHRSYVSWWTQRILKILLESDNANLSISDISAMTAIEPKDI
jgi:MOZ/SAS family